VGHRVVVRRRVGVGSHGRDVFTDLLGELVALDDTTLRIRTDDGAEHTIARSEVAAAKPIPPRPTRYSEMDALERVADACWPAPTHQRLGDWFLRAADGFTNRANSALPLGDPGLPLFDAIDACVAWYRARDLVPRLTVPLPLRRDVADALVARGWHAQPPVLVQTAALPDLAPAMRPPSGSTSQSGVRASEPTPAEVRLLEAPSAKFLGWVAARKTQLPGSASHVLTAVDLVRFAEIRDPIEIRHPAGTDDPARAGEPTSTSDSFEASDPTLPNEPTRASNSSSASDPTGTSEPARADDGAGTRAAVGTEDLGGRLAAIGRGAIVDGWLHLSLIEVAEHTRRRGLARRVISALAGWAAENGATRAVLQVEEQNAPAVALYAKLAFTTHHRYVTYRSHG
jgi:ribosomal protein S18 acetylase RimI-like enzyme